MTALSTFENISWTTNTSEIQTLYLKSSGEMFLLSFHIMYLLEAE